MCFWLELGVSFLLGWSIEFYLNHERWLKELAQRKRLSEDLESKTAAAEELRLLLEKKTQEAQGYKDLFEEYHQMYKSSEVSLREEKIRVGKLEQKVADIEQLRMLETTRLTMEKDLLVLEREGEKKKAEARRKTELEILRMREIISFAPPRRKEFEEEIAKRQRWLDAPEIELEVIPNLTSFRKDVPAVKCGFALSAESFQLTPDVEKNATISISPKPFSKGAFRLAYHGSAESSETVFKRLILTGKPEEDCKVHLESLRLLLLAAHFAELFSRAKPAGSPGLRYVCASLYRFEENKQQVVAFAEERLTGTFVKYNSNDRFVRNSAESGDTGELPQAFSHYTHHVTTGKLLICDIQGCLVRSSSDGALEYVLTDPACHQVGPRHEFGDSNRGAKGIDQFFADHKCNCYCRQMGLSHPIH